MLIQYKLSQTKLDTLLAITCVGATFTKQRMMLAIVFLFIPLSEMSADIHNEISQLDNRQPKNIKNWKKLQTRRQNIGTRKPNQQTLNGNFQLRGKIKHLMRNPKKIRGWQASHKGPKNIIMMDSDKQTPRIDLHIETDSSEMESDGIGEFQAASKSLPPVGGGAALGGGVLPWVGTIAAAQLMAVG